MKAGVILEEHHKSLEKHLEKQMGCMAGFFQIFDRHQILLSGKRVYSTKRLPSSLSNTSPSPSPSPSERSDASPPPPPPPSPPPKQPESAPPRPSLPLAVFDFKEACSPSLKLKDSPRLSLDSRVKGTVNTYPAAAAATGGSPSVVARLMGLDALPKPSAEGAELRRSASESRASRDLLQYTFLQDSANICSERTKEVGEVKSKDKKPRISPRHASAPAKKSFFDAQDFFPETTKPPRGSLYGKIERKLGMRGIDEPSKDLETLKQILEALQLKGLLHSHENRRAGNRNLIVDEYHKDPIRSRFAASPPHRKNPRRERISTTGRTRTLPDPVETKSPSSVARRRRISPAQSPRSVASSPRRAGPDSANALPRFQRIAAAADFEKVKMGRDYSEGRSLLERCDKLLHNIAAITESGGVVEQQQQPSPVSVLQSSTAFYSDDAAASPSSMNIKDRVGEREEQHWMPSTSPAKLLQPVDKAEAVDRDFAYVADILSSGESTCIAAADDAFVLLDKDRGRMEPSSKVSCLHRRLLFDIVVEIIDRKRQVTPWEAFSQSHSPFAYAEAAASARQVWDELRRLREHVPANDHLDAVCVALQKDMAGGMAVCNWGDRSVDMSDAVLDIERLIFKDLIVETIRDLATCRSSSSSTVKCRAMAAVASVVPRRKLVF